MKRPSQILSVDCIESDSKFEHPPVAHSILPQHPFSTLVVASKGSGKTNLLCNFILKQYKGYFHQIIVCSPTVDNDPKWDIVKKTKGVLKENVKLKEILTGSRKKGAKKVPKIVHNSEGDADEHREKEMKGQGGFDGKIPLDSFIEDMDKLPGLMKKQNEIVEKLHELGYETDEIRYKLLDRILLIEDDMAGLYRQGSTNNPLANLLFKQRHFNASMIKVTQAYKAMPSSLRLGMNSLICFEISNQQQLEVIYDEWQMGMTKPEWMAVFKEATREPYSFLYFNNDFPKGQRVYKKFDYLIDVGNEEDHEGESARKKAK